MTENSAPAKHHASRVVGYAYPWDVIGDPAFVDRLEKLGIEEVTLAASYHGTRAATPQHPLHRVVEAPNAALYRPVREAVWHGQELQPITAGWVASADAFADAAGRLIARGIAVDAWTILAHSTRLGTLRPDLVVRNCFGDKYSYALCPGHEQVQQYVTTLATEAVQGVAISGVSIEGLGQLGFAHNGVHEKTVGAYGPAAQRILSICCCSACRTGWQDAGLDPDGILGSLRTVLNAVQSGEQPADASIEALLGPDVAETLLQVRLSAQANVRRQVLGALREVAPAARLTLHGQADPWATGPSPAVPAVAATEVDAILVPAWSNSPDTYAAITAARTLAPAPFAVAAYVSVLPPTDLRTVDDHVAALMDAGTDELHLYHLGLASPTQLAALGRIVRHWK